MHRWIIFAIFIGMFLSVMASQSARAAGLTDEAVGIPDGLSIVKNAVAEAVIVLPHNANLRVRRGADTLVEYIAKSTDVKLRILTENALGHEGEVNDTAILIYVGGQPTEYEDGIASILDGLDEQGFVIYPRDRTITIIGPTIWGTLNGVHEFLERYVGVRWLMIGPAGEDVPTLTDITVPLRTIRENPAFAYRNLWYPFNGGEPYNPFAVRRVESEWAHRNKLQGNYNDRIKYGHNLHTIFPPEKFGKTNPEFYPKGRPPEPGDIRRWQPCFTVPATVDVAVEHIIDYFDKNPHEISFRMGVNDIGGFCEEDPAHPEYPGKRNTSGYVHMSDIYYRWVNEVAEKVTRVHPDKWFTLSAYREVMDPPSFSLHPRVVPRITKDRMTWIDDEIREIGHQQMHEWMQRASQVAWYDYMYGFMYYVPRVFPRLMVEAFQYAKEHNVVGWFIEHHYHAGEGPKAWILAKLLWNPDQDIEELLEEWYERAVGPEAAVDLAAYFDHWEHFWMERIPGTPWFEHGKVATYLQFPDPSYLDYVTDEDIEKSRGWLDAVVEKAQSEQQKARAVLIREAFEFVELSVLSYPKRMYSPKDEAMAMAMVDELVRTIDSRIDLADLRYERHYELTRHTDRNLHRATDQPGKAFFDYWWSDWTGWNSEYLKVLLNYLNVHEPLDGPVTDRIKALGYSDNSAERRLSFFARMLRGDYVDAPSLTRNGSFEDEEPGVSWDIQVDGNGTIRRSEDVAFTGQSSLSIERVRQGTISQTLEVERGLTGVQVQYFVPAGTSAGTIRLEIEGVNNRGAVATRFATSERLLSETTGEWATLTLVEALSSGLNRLGIQQGRVVVTVEGAQNARVYIDDIVVFQQFPRGAKVREGARVPSLPNVAMGKPVIGSSQINRSHLAVDGDPTTRWLLQTGSQPPHWLEVDLEGSYILAAAEVWSGVVGKDGPYSIPHMQLQYLKNGAWVDIPGASVRNNRAERVYFRFDDWIITNKVRFLSETPASPDGFGLRFQEFMIYGVPAGQSERLIELGIDDRAEIEDDSTPSEARGSSIVVAGGERPINVALNKPVKASSVHTTHIPENAVDGIWDSDNSRWLSRMTSTIRPPAWLEIDLQGIYMLTHAEVWTGALGSGGPETAKAAVPSFNLQYWMDGNWKDIPGASVDNNPRDNAKVEFQFESPVTTDKVRLYSEVEDNIRIREIMIFGTRSINEG